MLGSNIKMYVVLKIWIGVVGCLKLKQSLFSYIPERRQNKDRSPQFSPSLQPWQQQQQQNHHVHFSSQSSQFSLDQFAQQQKRACTRSSQSTVSLVVCYRAPSPTTLSTMRANSSSFWTNPVTYSSITWSTTKPRSLVSSAMAPSPISRGFRFSASSYGSTLMRSESICHPPIVSTFRLVSSTRNSTLTSSKPFVLAVNRSLLLPLVIFHVEFSFLIKLMKFPCFSLSRSRFIRAVVWHNGMTF